MRGKLTYLAGDVLKFLEENRWHGESASDVLRRLLSLEMLPSFSLTAESSGPKGRPSSFVLPEIKPGKWIIVKKAEVSSGNAVDRAVKKARKMDSNCSDHYGDRSSRAGKFID